MNIQPIRTFEEPSIGASSSQEAPRGDSFERALSSSQSQSESRSNQDSRVSGDRAAKESSAGDSDLKASEEGRADDSQSASTEAESETRSDSQDRGSAEDRKELGSGEENETREEDLTAEAQAVAEASQQIAADSLGLPEGESETVSNGVDSVIAQAGPAESVSGDEPQTTISAATAKTTDADTIQATQGGAPVEAQAVAQQREVSATASGAPVVDPVAVVAAGNAPVEATATRSIERRADDEASQGRSLSPADALATDGRAIVETAANDPGTNPQGDPQHGSDREGRADGLDVASFAQAVDHADAAAPVEASADSILGAVSGEASPPSGASPVQPAPVATILGASQVAPGTPLPAPAPDALAIQAEWLAARGGGSARLVLHPPELGEIAVRVTLRGGAVSVVIVAQEASARALAEGQADRLTEAFASRDLRLENFEVRRGEPNVFDEEDGLGFAGSDAQAREEAREDAEARASQTGGDRTAGSNRPGEDLPVHENMPKIVTVAAASGVDLRI